MTKLRGVKITLKDSSLKSNIRERQDMQENIFGLVRVLHERMNDQELVNLARKFPIVDFWAHSSSGMCGVCDDPSGAGPITEAAAEAMLQVIDSNI